MGQVTICSDSAHFLATGEGPVLNRVMEVAVLRRDGREFPAECRWSSHALGWAWYNRTSQGSRPRRTSFASRERLSSPRGKPSTKHGALSDHQRLIRQLGVVPLIYKLAIQ
jgi:hypothetical protein